MFDPIWDSFEVRGTQIPLQGHGRKAMGMFFFVDKQYPALGSSPWAPAEEERWQKPQDCMAPGR